MKTFGITLTTFGVGLMGFILLFLLFMNTPEDSSLKYTAQIESSKAVQADAQARSIEAVVSAIPSQWPIIFVFVLSIAAILTVFALFIKFQSCEREQIYKILADSRNRMTMLESNITGDGRYLVMKEGGDYEKKQFCVSEGGKTRGHSNILPG